MKVKIVMMTLTVKAKGTTDLTYRSAGAQFGYALKYIIPTLFVYAAIIIGMYYGGLGYAEIKTTYLQSPLFETTGLEANSLDAFFSFSFYCNSSALGLPIALTPRIPIGTNQSSPVFIPTPYGLSASPGFGCDGIAAQNGLSAVMTD